MKIVEIIRENFSGATTSGAMASAPLVGSPRPDQFFGGSMSQSIYNQIKKRRKKRKYLPGHA